jgi:hypothetical protein
LLKTTLITQQLSLNYDENTHLAVTVGSTGVVTYNATGTSAGSHVFSDNVKVNAAFGCNSATPQMAYSLGAAAGDTYGATEKAIINALRTALIACGIGS